VENFSYVFQASGSGTRSISREQMRSFKKIWAQFSNPKTRYLERSRFAAFFSVSLYNFLKKRMVIEWASPETQWRL
jgi:flagellar motor switch protein FliM